VSLFSGTGGLDLGFKQQGFATLLALDSSQIAVEAFNLNHPGHVAREADLSLTSGDEVADLVEACSGGLRPRGVIGGPPCQSFSIGNVHSKQDDPRRELPKRYAEIVAALNSRFGLDFFVFENVAGMRSKAHRAVYSDLLSLFDKVGFTAFAEEVDASRFGVAQTRRRILIVGFNKELYPKVKFAFPQGQSDPTSVRHKIWGLPEPVYFRRGLSPEDIAFHPNHWTMQPRSRKFKDGALTTKSRSFRRLDWDKPSWTVAYGHREIHVHPNGHRRLSILEAMLLQGFSQEHRLPGNLSQQVTLVSDAVPPPLAAALAEKIREELDLEEGPANAERADERLQLF
jgi:DNA (cytosine-5)-methyltransferase 1